jgi:hypothetical protein
VCLASNATVRLLARPRFGGCFRSSALPVIARPLHFPPQGRKSCPVPSLMSASSIPDLVNVVGVTTLELGQSDPVDVIRGTDGIRPGDPFLHMRDRPNVRVCSEMVGQTAASRVSPFAAGRPRANGCASRWRWSTQSTPRSPYGSGTGSFFRRRRVRREALCIRLEVRDLHRLACRSRRAELGGSHAWVTPGGVASGPDNAGTFQDCQMVRVRRAGWKGVRKEPVFTSLNGWTGPNLVDMGRERCAPVRVGGELLRTLETDGHKAPCLDRRSARLPRNNPHRDGESAENLGAAEPTGQAQTWAPTGRANNRIGSTSMRRHSAASSMRINL